MDGRTSPSSQFCCEICSGKKFANSQTFRNHLKTQRHLQQCKAPIEAPRFSCSVCSASFSRSANLSRHCNDHHSNESAAVVGLVFECETCSKRFSSLEGKIRHAALQHRRLTNFPTVSLSRQETVPLLIDISDASIGVSNSVSHVLVAQLEVNSTIPRVVPLSNANPTSGPVFPPNCSIGPAPPLSVPIRHCVTILFPALAADSHKLTKGNDQCSAIDRHAFALVLFSCCLAVAIGHHDQVRIIACQALTEEILTECASLLSLSSLWSKVAPRVTRFEDLASLLAAMNVANFVRSSLTTHSLFVVSYADSQRLRVHFGKKQHLLYPTQVSDLIHCCEPNHVHIMSCKAKKYSLSLQNNCSKRGICQAIIWCAYGADDVTTVPLDFGSPLSATDDWLTMPLNRDLEDEPHTHITASVQSFLCSLSQARGHTLEEIVRSVRVPVHKADRLVLFPGQIAPLGSIMGDIDQLFPFSIDTVPLLAQVGVSWAKYKWYLRKLEMTPRDKLKFV